MNGKNCLKGKEKEALDKLISGLKKLYGDNLDGVILYGSKARGDATKDSDIDIMITLTDYDDWSTEFDRVAGLVYTVEEEYDYALLISVIIRKKEEYRVRQTPLLLNVRKEGVNLWMR
ncbi:MAG: nucleotidyltransferase domain-containing protein [Elusimicrobia bacterium]|nr:nucleotidyltransferase domain-containing protein [Elusimicrobiota bacterium]